MFTMLALPAAGRKAMTAMRKAMALAKRPHIAGRRYQK